MKVSLDDHMKEYPADVFDMERLLTSIYQHGDMQDPHCKVIGPFQKVEWTNVEEVHMDFKTNVEGICVILTGDDPKVEFHHDPDTLIYEIDVSDDFFEKDPLPIGGLPSNLCPDCVLPDYPEIKKDILLHFL